MALEFGFEILLPEELMRKLQDGTLLAEPTREFLTVISVEVQRNTQMLTPVDTGRLRASWIRNVDVSPMPLWAEVSTNVNYAPFVEEGTRPHWPPMSALNPAAAGIRQWANIHGVNVYALGAAIAQRGTRGRHMLRMGVQIARGTIDNLLQQLIRRIKEEWAK